MIKIGMTVADRYEVLEKIGTGGMSDVYRAKDHKLNRHVAVKVLKQEFSENKDFLQKFRSEAQSAAGLMHPNIVNVYDVGEESGSHFIVMELVEGITLKKYIEKKARLSVREAVSIAIQVAQVSRRHIIIISYTGISSPRMLSSVWTVRLRSRTLALPRLLPAIPLPPMSWEAFIILRRNRCAEVFRMRRVIYIHWV